MSLHVKEIVAPGKWSEISHLILVPMPYFPKPVGHLSCIQVFNSRKAGIKMS